MRRWQKYLTRRSRVRNLKLENDELFKENGELEREVLRLWDELERLRKMGEKDKSDSKDEIQRLVVEVQ